MMKPLSCLILASGLLALSACEMAMGPTPRPNYAIQVSPTQDGGVATPPLCPSWNDAIVNPFDNQPLPQFGCANARNLASMVEQPNDLLEGREMGPERGVTAVGSIRRYDSNQTRGLVMPSAESSQLAASSSSNPTSPISGDVTGSSGSSSGASLAAP